MTGHSETNTPLPSPLSSETNIRHLMPRIPIKVCPDGRDIIGRRRRPFRGSSVEIRAGIVSFDKLFGRESARQRESKKETQRSFFLVSISLVYVNCNVQRAHCQAAKFKVHDLLC